jgi:ABC-2 type transport system permease protein
VLLRMRAEEADGPLEQILGTAVSRPRWMISHFVNAALGSLALLLVYAFGVGLTAGAVVGDVPAQVGDMLVAAVVQLPAILVIAGVVVATTALLPRWAGAVCWSLIVVFILLGPLFGAATFQLPEWTQNLSPFTHTPKLPGADVTAIPVVALVAIAAAFAVVGVAAFRRRNLALPT